MLNILTQAQFKSGDHPPMGCGNIAHGTLKIRVVYTTCGSHSQEISLAY